MGKEPEKEQLCAACGCHIGADAYQKNEVLYCCRSGASMVTIISVTPSTRSTITTPGLKRKSCATLSDLPSVVFSNI